MKTYQFTSQSDPNHQPPGHCSSASSLFARGMFYQDGLTGSAWGDWANYADSPLRAAADFSKEQMGSLRRGCHGVIPWSERSLKGVCGFLSLFKTAGYIYIYYIYFLYIWWKINDSQYNSLMMLLHGVTNQLLVLEQPISAEVSSCNNRGLASS